MDAILSFFLVYFNSIESERERELLKQTGLKDNRARLEESSEVIQII